MILLSFRFISFPQFISDLFHYIIHTVLYSVSLLLAPTKSPTIPFAHGISSTSIQFDLSFPRPYYAAYNVTGYTVRYWRVGSKERRSTMDELSTENKTFHLNGILPVGNTTVTLAGLEVYTKYCLSVQLVSGFGSGPFGFCTSVMTLEGGNKLAYINSLIWKGSVSVTDKKVCQDKGRFRWQFWLVFFPW